MKTRTRTITASRAAAAAAALAVAGWSAAALPSAAHADAGDPAGNNGTVKITASDGEGDGASQNTPHLSCGLDIEWYGFDEGSDIVSTVVFTMQAPTSDAAVLNAEPSEVFVGEDPAGGAVDFDGEATYTLSFDGEPDPQQGYHVKVTVRTAGSQGADTKHKVFWVKPCENPPI